MLVNTLSFISSCVMAVITLALGTLIMNAFSVSIARMLVAPFAWARTILPFNWSSRLGVISMPRSSALEIACLENATPSAACLLSSR